MPSGKYYLGVDQGTQSTKAVLFDSWGKEQAEAIVPVSLYWTPEGQITQDPDELFNSILGAISKAVKQSGISPTEISALAMDSQICSLVAVDEDLNPVYPIISHLDPSSNKIRDQLLGQFGTRILSQNGSMPYIASRLLWLKSESPASYQRISRVLLIGAYCAAKICGLRGEDAFADQTTMNVFGWGDLDSRSWDGDLSRLLGIDLKLSPEIRSPSEVIGGVQDDYAEICGLASGTPVIAGVGDAIAGWIGLGADHPGLLVDTSGTATHLCICVEDFIPDVEKRILSYYPSNQDRLGYQIGFMAGAGKTHRWVLDLFRDPVQENDSMPDAGFQYFEALAEEIPPGSDGVCFIPHFGGRACPPQPALKGGWLGLDWNHSQAHLYRSVLESIAYEYAAYLSRARAMYPGLDLKQIYSVGGGSKSALWTQIKANVLGLPVAVLSNADHLAARGSAMLGAFAVGEGQDFKPARYQQEPQVTLPNDENVSKYSDLQNEYNQIMEDVSGIFSRSGQDAGS